MSTVRRKKASKATNSARCTPEEQFFQQCAAVRPEVGVTGYWESLGENCKQWAEEVTVSKFWKLVQAKWSSWSADYRKQTGGDLLASHQLRAFEGKSERRIREKIFQRSIDLKQSEPACIPFPKVGAAVPEVNDLVRTRVECQFLDGVDYFAGRLAELATELKIKHTRNNKGGSEGYFAQHFYFEYPLLFRFGGGAHTANIQCEIQIATLLGTRIWTESHALYEFWRTRSDNLEEWQWSPNDPRFVARQLGHMIHLADGLLVQLRDTSRSYKTKK